MKGCLTKRPKSISLTCVLGSGVTFEILSMSMGKNCFIIKPMTHLSLKDKT